MNDLILFGLPCYLNAAAYWLSFVMLNPKHSENYINTMADFVRRTRATMVLSTFKPVILTVQNLEAYTSLVSSMPNPLEPGVKSIMKIQFGLCRQAMLQLHLSDQQSYCRLTCVLYSRFDEVWIRQRRYDLSCADRRCSNYIWVINNRIAY